MVIIAGNNGKALQVAEYVTIGLILHGKTEYTAPLDLYGILPYNMVIKEKYYAHSTN